MSARTVGVAILIIFFIIAVQASLAGPLTTIADSLNATGDYSDIGGHDGNEIITNLPGQWFQMGIIAIFGVMLWASWRVLRRELTRGGQL